MKTPLTPASSTEVLAPSLAMGAVALNVRDLAMMTGFYETIVGLEVIERSADRAMLGCQGKRIVELHRSDLPPASSRDAGLYHLAIVHESRSDLANAARRVIEGVPHLIAGSADHLVSEAFYLSDPEGNGIELYYDRDPATWQWENGLVAMAVVYLPPQEYIGRYAAKEQRQGGMRIGHVHLKIGDTEEARRFYIDVVGFTLTATMPSALFLSIGGYHHHLGMNTWESAGAGKREEALGLRSFEILLPRKEDIDSLEKRLREAKVEVEEREGELAFADGWGNRMLARAN